MVTGVFKKHPSLSTTKPPQDKQTPFQVYTQYRPFSAIKLIFIFGGRGEGWGGGTMTLFDIREKGDQESVE